MMHLFHKHTVFNFTICSLTDWSYVDYCDVFYQLFDSDGTHSLQRID